MKKCVFILPYFGRFNNYFNLFLYSCKNNPTYNWMIFTDDRRKFKYPENVEVIYCSFDDFRRKIQDKFDFEIVLPNPYKLCDFKPTYGYVLKEYIENYEYWGFCDCDVIFGNLDKFLTNILKSDYDKIFSLGHLTIFKNTDDNNRMFMNEYNGKKLYRNFLTTSDICWFDEDWKKDNIHSIFLNNKKRVYSDCLAFNPSGKYIKFVQRIYDSNKRVFFDEEKTDSVCYYFNGNIYRLRKENGTIISDEFLYVHLQHRKMVNYISDSFCSNFLILPNEFIKLQCSDINYIFNKYKMIRWSGIKWFLNIYKNKIKRKLRIGGNL